MFAKKARVILVKVQNILLWLKRHLDSGAKQKAAAILGLRIKSLKWLIIVIWLLLIDNWFFPSENVVPTCAKYFFPLYSATPNEDKLVPNEDNATPNEDNAAPNEDSIAPNEDNAALNDAK